MKKIKPYPCKPLRHVSFGLRYTTSEPDSLGLRYKDLTNCVDFIGLTSDDRYNLFKSNKYKHDYNLITMPLVAFLKNEFILSDDAKSQLENIIKYYNDEMDLINTYN